MEANIYAGVKGGWSGGYEVECEEIHTTLGTYIAGAVGCRAFSFFRIEGEMMVSHAHINSVPEGAFEIKHTKGSIRTYSVMINELVDLMNCQYAVKPYFGGGIGYGYARGHWSGSLVADNGHFFVAKALVKKSVHRQGFAWQVLAGLRYFICHDWEIDLEYKFFKIPNKLSNHNLGLTGSFIF